MGIKNIENFYPLSPMQQGMLFHSLAAPGSGVYFEQFSYTFKGDLNIAAFDRAWQQVIMRHSVLRTCFAWEGLKEPVQIVHRQVQLPLLQKDWRHLSATQQQEQIEAFLKCDRDRDFQLTVPPLMRLVLIQLAGDRYHFTLSFHHLLLDGWSVPLIFQEVFAYYQAYSQGRDISLASPRPYRDYIVWLQQQNLVEAESFWRRILKGFTAPMMLWGDRKSEQPANDNYNCQEIALEAPTTAALQALAQKHQLTLNTFVQGAWALLLSRYSNDSDIVFGATTSGRPSTLASAESMVGLFINTLPVRICVDCEAFLIPWLKQIQARQIEARQYEYTPLADIQNWSEIPKGLSLFENIVVFENFPVEEIPLANSNLNLEIEVSHSFERTNYPLTLCVIPSQKLLLKIEYEQCNYLNQASINRMLGHLKTLLEEMVTNSQQQLKDFLLLTETEKYQLLRWNDTKTQYPKEKCIHQLFEDQVKRTPDAIAVTFKDRVLTYRELNHRANQLAHYLQTLGVEAEITVGLYLERSLQMAVAILGTLKAGGVYIPIDPTYPRDRIKTILKDAQVEVILTQQYLEAKIGEFKAQIVTLDDYWTDISRHSTNNCQSQVISENLAYVIYTSGSTGKPKGVAVTHSALVNYTLDIAKQLELKQCDRFLQFASVGFDVVVEEIFPAWITGATVVLPGTSKLLGCGEFQQLIEQEQLTVFELPTAYWHQWVLELLQSQQTVPKCVRLVIVGGERISRERLKQWQQFSTPLIHVYGLTETTVTSTVYRLNSEAQTIETQLELPIGKPIANTQIYILNSYLQPVPVGVEGEIYIGGVGIARGYLNQETLTAERFIPNPFSHVAGARLYRTGDKAKYLPDGNIEYIGRIDHQVKLRGFRIELGEIEAALSQHHAIATTVAILRQDNSNNPNLVAYLTLQPEQIVTGKELRHYLESKLPHYMIPNAFVILSELPLTPNGKVDRKALPVPDSSQFISEEYLAPSTPIEEILANIWQEILGVEKVGVRDNFFELGGDSILSLQIVAKTHQAGLYITPKQIFQHQTIAELVSIVGEAKQNSAEQGMVTGSFPLTPIQAWFFEQNFPVPHHWNQSILLETRTRIDPILLEQAVQKLLEHHDMLRLCFELTSSAFKPIIVSKQTVSVTYIDLSKVSSEQLETEIVKAANELQASFNLSTGPLIKVGLFDCGTKQSGRLLIVLHHLIVDDLSWRILLEDFQVIYQQLVQEKPIKLPLKTTSFKQWSNRIQKYAQSQALCTELDYWLTMLHRSLKPLPKDYPGKDNLLADTKTITVSLSIEDTQALLKEIPAIYRSQINDVLLTALVETFARWTGERSLLFDLEGHGREELFEDIDLSRTVGWFTSIYPVLLNLERAIAPSEALKATKEQLRNIPNNGISYGLLRYLNKEQKVSELLNRLPQAEICFNYLGQHDRVLTESSLFQAASESSGNGENLLNSRAYLFEINSAVEFGSLQIRFSYNKKLHKESTVKTLANGFIEALKSLIKHSRETQIGFSLSDFPLIDLTQEELDSAFDRISY